jgi:hypothetical protein
MTTGECDVMPAEAVPETKGCRLPLCCLPLGHVGRHYSCVRCRERYASPRVFPALPAEVVAALDKARDASFCLGCDAGADRDLVVARGADRAARAAALQAICKAIAAPSGAEAVVSAALALVESEDAWTKVGGNAECVWCGARREGDVWLHGSGCAFGLLLAALVAYRARRPAQGEKP